MAKLTPFPSEQVFDDNGNPLAYGKIHSKEADTVTDKDTFTDESGDTTNPNPIILDENGRFASNQMWLGEGAYYIEVRDANGVFVDSRDDISGDVSGSFLGGVFSLSTNTTINAPYQNSFISATGTISLSLLAASDAGEGFTFAVKNDGAGIVTIDPDGAETPITILNPNQWAIYTCDGTNWKVLDKNDPKNNLNASVAPTVNEDSDDGYSVSSKWYDTTNDEAYVCLDATVGAAVWVNTTLSIDELGSAALADLIDDDTFATATDSNVPSAESVKAYTDNAVSASGITLGTEQATTSGNSFSFSSIPSGTKRIGIHFEGNSLNGSGNILIQLADGGGTETTGYSSVSCTSNGTCVSSSTGFIVRMANSGTIIGGGTVWISLKDAANFTWVASGNISRSDTADNINCNGAKSLSAELTGITITTTAGDFDAGSLNITYES